MTLKDAMAFAKIHERHRREMIAAGWKPCVYDGVDDALYTLMSEVMRLKHQPVSDHLTLPNIQERRIGSRDDD